MISLPIVLSLIQEIPICSGKISHLFIIPLYSLCIFSLIAGFRRMHRQELLRKEQYPQTSQYIKSILKHL